MTSITTHRLRDAFDAQIERAATQPDAARSRFDYARLVHASKAAHRPVTRTAQSSEREPDTERSTLDESGSGQQPACPTADEDPASHEAPATIDDDSIGSPAWGSRVADAVEPVVSTLLVRQQRIVDLVSALAREIAGFCSDPSIASGGHWDVQMKLDERLFRQTTLYLRLSGLAVSLRFDAVDAEAKQLLLDHSSMLERELGAALRAWGESRDIQLTIW